MSLRIIIVGGGFGGVTCAQTLRSHLSPKDCEIVLFDRENHMVFHPLLAEVAGASINPDAAAVPLRNMLPTVSFRSERVANIDFAASAIDYQSEDGRLHRMPYDQVIVSCGSIVNLGLIPGMSEHAFPLKTVGDAMALRNHLLQQMERADVTEDPERRKWHMTFLVAGGGYSGIEIAGEINDLIRGSRDRYPNIRAEDIRVIVVHSRDAILPEITPKLRGFAQERMQKAGVEFVLNARVATITPDGVRLADGRSLQGATVVSTIGNTVTTLANALTAPKEKGLLLTEQDMRVQGFKNAWAMGDCARVINAYDGEPCAPTAQFATRQGKHLAKNLIRSLRHEATQPFSFKPLGQLCSIGGHKAVAEVFGLRVSGFVAWFLWRGTYLFKMPTWSRRMKIGFDWAWDILFQRDLVYTKPNTTSRVSSATFAAGDFVFRAGEPATSFYVIEKGEVEVLRKSESGGEKIVAVLGPGDFFGEMSLLEKRPHSASVRARSLVRVLTLGDQSFTQLSGALTMLRGMVANAAKRRSSSVWERVPVAQARLESQPLSKFIEPPPTQPLLPATTYKEAIETFSRQVLDVCYVCDGGGRLAGVLTHRDLFNAIQTGAKPDTPVEQVMTANPVAMTPSDSMSTLIETMRDHTLRWVPVVDSQDTRKLIGYVRAEKLLEEVLAGEPAKVAGDGARR